MTCLHHFYSSLLPIHATIKPQQQQHIGMGHTTKLFWGEPTTCNHFPSASSLSTKALPHFIVAAATSPPKPGDPSTFLPVSALLISVYFIANFVVPDFLTKYFGFDKLNEDQKVDDVEDK
ncbi:uncharacterized protein [Cicer arietinum]|uniref:Uncharacterized protein LOC101509251 n=1 Tax=Cicer arietinum TaxID=3827 RepID=A0A1S2XM23_CICAR|nr:uncharacterized protein LOC101509251 [Cicer arietinum]